MSYFEAKQEYSKVSPLVHQVSYARLVQSSPSKDKNVVNALIPKLKTMITKIVRTAGSSNTVHPYQPYRALSLLPW